MPFVDLDFPGARDHRLPDRCQGVMGNFFEPGASPPHPFEIQPTIWPMSIGSTLACLPKFRASPARVFPNLLGTRASTIGGVPSIIMVPTMYSRKRTSRADPPRLHRILHRIHEGNHFDRGGIILIDVEVLDGAGRRDEAESPSATRTVRLVWGENSRKGAGTREIALRISRNRGRGLDFSGEP